MTTGKAGAVLAALLATACSSAERPPSPPLLPAPKTLIDAGATAAQAPHCPSDLSDFLLQHERAFGTPAQLAALGPQVLHGELGGAETRLLLDGDHTSFALLLGPGAEVARGIDARRYLSDFQVGRDRLGCEVDEGVAQISVTYKRPDMGNPVLWFDLQTKELRDAVQTRSAGQPRTLHFDRWRAGEGVAFPTGWTDTILHGHVAVTSVKREEHFDEVEGRLAVSVPEGGATFPMRIHDHHVYLPTK